MSSPERRVQPLAEPFGQGQADDGEAQRDQAQQRRLGIAARHLQRGVDGQRQGLGFTGDAGGEGDFERR